MAGADLFPVSKPPSLEGVESNARIEIMVDWFGENFEDPAQQTPYESAEGGYIYIWGGPYDAREEIEDAFPEATEEEIVAAVEEVQSDGLFDWAPHGSRIRDVESDYVDDGYVEEGYVESPQPIAERLKELASQLDTIQNHIDFWRNQPPGIGHNGAPGEFTISPDDADLVLAEQSVSEVRAELGKADPTEEADFEVLDRAEDRFKKLAAKIKAALAAAGKWVVEGALKGLGGAMGVDIYNNPQKFASLLNDAAVNIGYWISHLQTPF